MLKKLDKPFQINLILIEIILLITIATAIEEALRELLTTSSENIELI